MVIDLYKLKEIAEIFYNLVVGFGIIFGGLWGYYRYVKGRLFSPQIETTISHSLINKAPNSSIFSVEVQIKNTGTIGIRPNLCSLEVEGININKGKIAQTEIDTTDNLVEDPWIEHGTSFLEPQQTDWYSAAFVIPKRYNLIKLTSRFVYNKHTANIRNFYINLNEK